MIGHSNTRIRKKTWMRYAASALFVLAALLLMQALPTGQWIDATRSWVESTGPWGPLIFSAVYVIAVIALVPGSALTFAGGALFGLLWGTIITSVASNVGAACAFLIARYLARSRVQQLAAESSKFKAMDDAIAEGGWKIVAMLRLSPAVPFNLQNYLYGLTQIRFWPCVLTSWLAMLPGTFMYVYFGHIGVSAASGASGGADEGGRSTLEWIALSVGLLATIALTVYLTRLARRKLQAQTEIAEADTGPTETKADDQARQTNNNASTRPPMREWILLAAGALAVAGAIVAIFFSDSIEQWLTT